jgi:hypothetical protein
MPKFSPQPEGLKKGTATVEKAATAHARFSWQPDLLKRTGTVEKAATAYAKFSRQPDSQEKGTVEKAAIIRMKLESFYRNFAIEGQDRNQRLAIPLPSRMADRLDSLNSKKI